MSCRVCPWPPTAVGETAPGAESVPAEGISVEQREKQLWGWQCQPCPISWWLWPSSAVRRALRASQGHSRGCQGCRCALGRAEPLLEIPCSSRGQAGLFPGREGGSPGCSHPLWEGRDEPLVVELWLLPAVSQGWLSWEQPRGVCAQSSLWAAGNAPARGFSPAPPSTRPCGCAQGESTEFSSGSEGKHPPCSHRVTRAV